VLLAAGCAAGAAALPFEEATAPAKILGALGGAPSVPAPKGGAEAVRPEVGRLRVLVEAGEQDVELKDWDGASNRADEAEVLVADWSDELMARPEVAVLLTRLQQLERHLSATAEPGAEPDPGLKDAEEVVPLSPAELKAELAQVVSAEAGAIFDFPIDLNDKVLAWVHEFTTSKRGFMERTLTRSTRYLPMVRQIFAEERVPQDLAYLAVIESGFLNSANSYAKAVGMWQFMRATGRIYGLNGNAWVEERRDPVKATRAAARYLRRLYELSGDWYLALVGYNAGPLTTERAIQNLGTRNFWDMSRSRWLRDQTKNYVPEMCAAVLVGRFPGKYGLNVDQLPPYAYETVEVDRMTSLPVLARFAGVDVDALRELNPELLRASTPPGHYPLRVPPGASGTTARALARIPANQRLDFKSYKIRKGDTLARLAARFKVGTEDLLAANDLTKAQFRAGRTIKVPPPPPGPIDDRDLLPRAERTNLIAEQPLQDLPALPDVRPAGSDPRMPGAGQGTAGPQAPGPDPRAPEAGQGAAQPLPSASAKAGQGAAQPLPPVSAKAGQGAAQPLPPVSAKAGQGAAQPLPSASAKAAQPLPSASAKAAPGPAPKPAGAASASPSAKAAPEAPAGAPAPDMAPPASVEVVSDGMPPPPAGGEPVPSRPTAGNAVPSRPAPGDAVPSRPAAGDAVRQRPAPAERPRPTAAGPAPARPAGMEALSPRPATEDADLQRPAQAERPRPVEAQAAPAGPEAVAPRPSAHALPARAKAAPAEPARSHAAPAPPAAETRPATHVVKPGDTLFALAARYGVEVKDLRKWNRIKGNKLKAGQRLRLRK